MNPRGPRFSGIAVRPRLLASITTLAPALGVAAGATAVTTTTSWAATGSRPYAIAMDAQCLGARSPNVQDSSPARARPVVLRILNFSDV